MLAQGGGWEAGLRALAVEEVGGGQGEEVAERHELTSSPSPLHRLADRGRRRARDAMGSHDPVPVRGRTLAEDVGEERVELGPVADPVGVGCKAWVGLEIRPVDGLTEAPPLVLAADTDQEPAIPRGKGLVGREVRVARSEGWGLAAVREPGLGRVGEKG